MKKTSYYELQSLAQEEEFKDALLIAAGTMVENEAKAFSHALKNKEDWEKAKISLRQIINLASRVGEIVYGD